MADKDQVARIVLKAIDELNATLPDDQQVAKALTTRLLGCAGQVDSLGLVNLIVSVEQKVQEAFDVIVVLADEKAMSQAGSPFRSVETLVELTLDRVNDSDGSDG